MADSLSSITGISSGLDYRALVDQIIKLERRPADRLQAQLDADKRRGESLDRFRTLVQALRTAAEDLRSGAALEAFSVTAAGTDGANRALLAATAAAGAAPGTYAVRVQALATAHKLTAGVGQASATTPLGLDGAFELRRPDGTVAGSVTVTAADSLTAVRDRLNALNTGATPSRVQASLIAGGADGSNQRLVLGATATGEANAFTLVATAGTALAALGLDAAGASPPTVTAAGDAVLDIDGVPVRRPSNTVADAIPNVTLTLSAADPARPATVTVERLGNAVQGSVKAFAEAYNALVDFAAKEGATTGTGPLRGDGMLRGVRGLLAGALLANAAAGPDDLRTLAGAGLTTDKTGRLTVDAARLTERVGGRLDDLRAVFADRGAAFTALLDDYTRDGTGLLAQRRTVMEGQSAARSRRIEDIDARLELKKASLLRQYARFEASLGRLKALGDSMSAQFSALTKSKD